MAGLIPPPMVLAISGTSLSSDGRLATPDNPWRQHLERYMNSSPLCKGPVTILNLAKGSAQSNWGKLQAQTYAHMKPTHLLREDFAVNDCVAVGAPGDLHNTQAIVPVATSEQNFEDEVDLYLAQNPTIKIALMTMSSVSASQTLRANMVDWINAIKAKAVALDIPVVDNYADWPKPLDATLTDSNDGLHVKWGSAFELYSWPNIKAQVDLWLAEHFA